MTCGYSILLFLKILLPPFFPYADISRFLRRGRDSGYSGRVFEVFLTQAWVFSWEDILWEDNSQLFREAFCHLFMCVIARMDVGVSGEIVVAMA